MQLPKLLLASTFCFFLLCIPRYNTSSEEQAKHEETYIPYKNWNDYTEEELEKLKKRWTPEKVDKVIRALRRGDNLDALVHKSSNPNENRSYDLRLIGSISEINLSRVNIQYANLQGALLPNANFKQATLRGVNFEGAVLIGSNFQESDLSGANLSEAFLYDIDFQDANLIGVDFHDSDLSGTNFENADLHGANFQITKLNQSNLKDANLYDAYFESTYLWRANIGEAKNIRYITWGEMYAIDEKLINYLKSVFLIPQKNLELIERDQNRIFHGQTEFINYLKLILDIGFAYRMPMLPSDRTQYDLFQNKELQFNRNKQFIMNSASITPTFDSYIIGEENDWDLQNAEITYRDLKSFYKEEKMDYIANKFHYRENVVRTKSSTLPIKIFRTVFLDWTYGYGSRPLRLIPFCFGVIFIFALVYLFLTIPRKSKSGIYLVQDEVETLLPIEHGKILLNCLYFSILSFSTFGYGALKPRQWLEFFRLEPVEFKPKKWARIFVGLEAAIGIYLLALIAIVLFKG